MTVTPRITVSDGSLVVHGRTILTGVPDNIILTPASGVGLVGGAFIGASSSDAKSIHVFPMGTLRGLRFMCCFRFKLWWMTQRMGTSGKDVPLETQFMLVESKDEDAGDGETIYTVFLPLLEGQFRSALQGNERDEIEVCLESGDKDVETKQGMNMVYLHAGNNPFQVINQAVKHHLPDDQWGENKMARRLDFGFDGEVGQKLRRAHVKIPYNYKICGIHESVINGNLFIYKGRLEGRSMNQASK